MMRIGFIGAGRVGCTLGKHFTEHGIPVSGYYSRTLRSAKQAADFTHTGCYETLRDVVLASDALFLTVPDGQIGTLWKDVKELAVENKIFCHCSGALSSAVFSEIDRIRGFGYSIHPLFAVNSKTESYRDFSQAFFAIEGHPRYLAFWQNLLTELGHPVRVLSAAQKPAYHAAAVMASNLVVGLFAAAGGILQECGFAEDEAMQALTPLFLNNASHIEKDGPVNALTGPVERGDAATVAQALAHLNGNAKTLYLLLSEQVLEIARKKNPHRDYSALEQTLNVCKTDARPETVFLKNRTEKPVENDLEKRKELNHANRTYR